MRYVKALVAAMLVLGVAGALGACGSGEGESSEPAEVVSGKLAPVAGAPPAYSELAGEAALTRGPNGSKISISASGLEPNTAYIAHLHTGGCDQTDPGGPHFQFERGGSEKPPNEVHLRFSSDAVGEGMATVSSKRVVPAGEAGSVVLHLDRPHRTAAAEDGTEPVTIFVHEGEDHPAGGDHGSGHARSDKIACADLEGPAAAAGDSTAAGDVPTIVVRDGEPVGGVEELEFSSGEEVRFRVSSDQAEEIHVHGYDLAQDVPAGGTIEFDFAAEIEGIFEVELEKLGAQIAELRINP